MWGIGELMRISADRDGETHLHEAATWAIRELGIKDPSKVKIQKITRGGSARRYLRLSSGTKRAVLMIYDTERRENSYFVPIGRFLSEIGVPVPMVFAWNEEERWVLLEDLGDHTLWSLRNSPPEEKRRLYRLICEAIAPLHRYPLDIFCSRGVPIMGGFDEHLYRWERDYFRENFVRHLMGLTLTEAEESALEEELAELGKRLLSFPPCLIHRDFQSQNIMIRNGKPYFVDFQGMRVGNLYYDLSSLVYDPYVTFTDGERLEVALYYYEIRGYAFGREVFLLNLREAAAQRLMQALGAYAYLGKIKGYHEFLQYVKPGLENLISVTSQLPTLPCLHHLSLRLDKEMPGT